MNEYNNAVLRFFEADRALDALGDGGVEVVRPGQPFPIISTDASEAEVATAQTVVARADGGGPC